MHKRGQLAPRERLQQLLDPDSIWVEIGLLVAYDQYDGQAPGAGVITGAGTAGSSLFCWSWIKLKGIFLRFSLILFEYLV